MNLPRGAKGRVQLPVIQPDPLVVKHVSASQFKTYTACARQWWFDKVAKVPRPARPYLDFGTEVHGHLEAYLKHGQRPVNTTPSGRAALAGLSLLPEPQGFGMMVEADLDPPLEVVPGVVWVGRADVLIPPPDAWVIDHKTTKDWRWMKSPQELQTDPQVVSYALWSMRHHGGSSVRVSHVYYHSQPERLGRGTPAARRVDTTVHRDAAEYLWAGYQGPVRALVSDGLKVDVSEVEPNWDACDNYGGCPYRQRCAMNGQKVTLGAVAMAARNGGPAAQAPAPQAAPPPEDDGLVLYLGCAPLTGPHSQVARPLESLVAEYAAPILAAQNVVDLRLVPYAQGKGLLAGAFRDNPPRGVYFGSTSVELNAVAVEALVPLARTVVRNIT